MLVSDVRHGERVRPGIREGGHETRGFSCYKRGAAGVGHRRASLTTIESRRLDHG
jgi:hypothetical protein